LGSRVGFVVTTTTTTPERVPALEKVAQRVVVVKGNDPVGLQSVVQNQETVLLSVGAANPNVYAPSAHRPNPSLSPKTGSFGATANLHRSYAVYGDREGAWVDEASPVAPANRMVKFSETEVLLSASSDDMSVCILRLGGIYGPRRELVKIFGRVAGTIRPGNGEDAQLDPP